MAAVAMIGQLKMTDTWQADVDCALVHKQARLYAWMTAEGAISQVILLD